MSNELAGATATVPTDSQHSFYGGVARSLARGLGLYFSRPVRLFRPSRISGWTSLRGAAAREGATLTPQYISLIVKQKGLLVLSRHFLPPLAINAFLGTILFQSYTGISTALSDACPDHSSIIIAAASGAAAGAIQSVIGAPADNVRILLENGSLHGSLGGHSGWRDAWKVIFKGPETLDPRPESLRVDGTQPNGTARTSLRHQARDAKRWMNEVKGMAGRGWDGWGWGCAKDVVGFSLFFMVFDISRNFSSQVAVITNSLTGEPSEAKTRHLAPRVAHSVTLVTGGVIAGIGYEIIGRPFDNARRLLYLDNIRARSSPHPPPSCPPKTVIFNAIRDQGIISFFQTRDLPNADRTGTSLHRTLRTLARVGPWGVGFLLWNLWDESIIEDI